MDNCGNTGRSMLKTALKGPPVDSNKSPLFEDERLKSVEPRMIEIILNEVISFSDPLHFSALS